MDKNGNIFQCGQEIQSLRGQCHRKDLGAPYDEGQNQAKKCKADVTSIGMKIAMLMKVNDQSRIFKWPKL